MSLGICCHGEGSSQTSCPEQNEFLLLFSRNCSLICQIVSIYQQCKKNWFKWHKFMMKWIMGFVVNSSPRLVTYTSLSSSFMRGRSWYNWKSFMSVCVRRETQRVLSFRIYEFKKWFRSGHLGFHFRRFSEDCNTWLQRKSSDIK